MATEHLRSEMFAAVVVDHDLSGEGKGLDLLAQVKEINPTPAPHARQWREY